MEKIDALLISRLRMALFAADLNLTEYEAALIITIYEAVKEHGGAVTIEGIAAIKNVVQKNVKQ